MSLTAMLEITARTLHGLQYVEATRQYKTSLYTRKVNLQKLLSRGNVSVSSQEGQSRLQHGGMGWL